MLLAAQMHAAGWYAQIPPMCGGQQHAFASGPTVLNQNCCSGFWVQHGGHAPLQARRSGPGSVCSGQQGTGAAAECQAAGLRAGVRWPGLLWRLWLPGCVHLQAPCAAHPNLALSAVLLPRLPPCRCGTFWSGRDGTRSRQWQWRSARITSVNWMCPAQCATCSGGWAGGGVVGMWGGGNAGLGGRAGSGQDRPEQAQAWGRESSSAHAAGSSHLQPAGMSRPGPSLLPPVFSM